MKKITALALMLTMLMSIFAFNSSAAILVQSNFNEMDVFTQNFHAGAFYTEDNLLFGYAEAKCLQTKGEFFTYDTTIEVAFEDDELSDAERAFSLWYCNINLEAYGRFDGPNYMRFGYSIEDQCFYLTADDVNTAENKDLVARVPYELEDGEFHTFGLSVTRGRLRGFINNKLVIDFVDTKDEYLIGLQDDATYANPHVYWNDGNFIQIKDVKISTPEYFFPMAPAGEVTTTTAKPVETTTKISEVVVTDKEGNDVTDDSGKKVTETVIITDAPVADTNTGAVLGGNATSTGDKAVIVVAAMIVALGTALIVKKVSVR